MHLLYPLIVSALLFSIGVYGVLARRNAILVLLSVELMLNAVNLNLVAFDVWLRDELHAGQVFALYVITIAAAEIGLGLAIVLLVFRERQTADIDTLRDLGERQYDALVEADAAAEAEHAGAAGEAVDPAAARQVEPRIAGRSP